MTPQNRKQPGIQNETVVVTGGAGFIGSNLVHKLAKSAYGNHVVILDNLTTGHLYNLQDLLDVKKQEHLVTSYIKNREEQKIREQQLPDGFTLHGDNVTFIKVDIRDRVLLRNVFKKYKPGYVFHLAAVASVPQSIQDPYTTHEVNVTGTLNLLHAAKDTEGIKRFIFSSSCAVYGNPECLPVKETAPTAPLSPYAATKLMGEQYCNVFTKIYDLPTVALRYFNVYGPRQDPNSEYAAVIPKFIHCVRQGKPLTIFGDGKQTRDFIYVDDVVAANIHVSCVDASVDAGGCKVLNVGTGCETSICFLAEVLLQMHGYRGEMIEKYIQYAAPSPGDIYRSYADVHALTQTGFNVSWDLKAGLMQTIGFKGEMAAEVSML